MKIAEKILDYIKSWIYYPKMKKYYEEKKLEVYNPWRNERFARFKYAWWHCHVGKLKG